MHSCDELPSCLIKRAPCSEADLASVPGGSFLLAIVYHVNGCKNIIRPVISDRLPPLGPAATGDGMGVHINLQRNLWEPRHHAQQPADKSSRDNKANIPGSPTPSRFAWTGTIQIDGGVEGNSYTQVFDVYDKWQRDEHAYPCRADGVTAKCSTGLKRKMKMLTVRTK